MTLPSVAKNSLEDRGVPPPALKLAPLPRSADCGPGKRPKSLIGGEPDGAIAVAAGLEGGGKPIRARGVSMGGEGPLPPLGVLLKW